MSVDEVKVDNEHSQLWLYLPTPKIVKSGYRDEIRNEELSVLLQNGAEMPPDELISAKIDTLYHKTVDEIDLKDYEAIINQNARDLFEEILKELNFQYINVRIADAKYKKGGENNE